MKGKSKTQKAITLIALIITIVVLLILATVAINSITNNGILDNAKKAADKYAKKQEEEATRLQEYLDFLNGNPSGGEKNDTAVGVMGSDNTITLSGGLLTAGSYTLKYENASGVMSNYAEICTLEITNARSNAVYDDFIVENCAPQGATAIGVYNSEGTKVGIVPLSSTFAPNLGNKLYSFGAISDVHLQETGADVDFKRALTYLNTVADIDFINITGDITKNGTDTEFAEYKEFVNAYSTNVPVYAITGNHDTSTHLSEIVDVIETYTGEPLYYSFLQGNDVFIMVGLDGKTEGNIFSRAELQWLQKTLEENKDKRCFIFQHVGSDESSGNPNNIYPTDIWGGDEQVIFESLMLHYPNVIWFHGHSHTSLLLQRISDSANYNTAFGRHSIHVPGLETLRDCDSNGSLIYRTDGSEGYIVDVYENGILLKGFDFVNEKFLTIAQYYLNTCIKSVSANTYVDSTGVLNIDNSNLILSSIDTDGSIFNGIGYIRDKRLNSSGVLTSAEGINVSGFVPVKNGDVVHFENMKLPIGNSSYAYCYVWLYDSNFQKVKGTAIHTFSDKFNTYTTDADGNLSSLTIDSNVAYMRVSYKTSDEYAIITKE